MEEDKSVKFKTLYRYALDNNFLLQKYSENTLRLMYPRILTLGKVRQTVLTVSFSFGNSQRYRIMNKSTALKLIRRTIKEILKTNVTGNV